MQKCAISAFVSLFVVIATTNTALGQKQSVRQRNEITSQTSPAKKQTIKPIDKWWQAQQNIETAIQQLETYLRQSPSGERAESARQQLQVLQSLTASAIKPEWSRLYLGPAATSDWRIDSIDLQAERTLVTLEIRCAQDFNGECGFPAFDSKNPLVLLDNVGRYYPMLESSQMPDGVRRVDDFNSAQYRFQPGRTITVKVEFAPLMKGAVSGQVQYRERNLAIPAKFSLLRRKG